MLCSLPSVEEVWDQGADAAACDWQLFTNGKTGRPTDFMEILYDYHNIISRDKICSSLTTYTRLMDLYPGELAVSLTRSKVT